MKYVSPGRCWLSLLLLLQMPVGPLRAAEPPRVVGHPPAAVARGTVVPLGRVPGTNQLRLALSLPLRQAGEFTNLLASIYRPASPEFHHYLTPREFAARFGPTPDDYATVIQFAQTNGLTVTATHPSRLLVDVSGRVADVERALHVKLYSFRHPSEPRNFFAPDTAPTVDARLPLLQVSGLDDFVRPHPNFVASPLASSPGWLPNVGSGPNGWYMGNDFRQAYVPGTVLTGTGQSVGLLEFDVFNLADITNYANTIGLTNNLPQITAVPVGGGVTSSTYLGHAEVALDIEMVLSMAPGVSNIYVYEAPGGSPWVDILNSMAETNLAAQLSCSWTVRGSDPESELIFQQMAAQGQSFFNASGDSGAYAGEIEFPCASPNLTVVGGTSLVTDTNGDYLSESVWNWGGTNASGGGFAVSVGIPLWQMGLDMTTNGGSIFWRNVPDVALAADNVYVFVDGQIFVDDQGNPAPVVGTSCAAPLWAAFTALANQQATQLGQPSVGFLNPAIYSLCRGTNYAAFFQDITSGNNTNAYSPTNFQATPGFDLCTGWGTPAGTNLINALTTPDPLGILPQNVFSTGGLVGGPFPQTNWLLTLTNSGSNHLDWSLGGVPAWLTVSAGNGTLAANGSTNLTVQWVNPNRMPAGGYPAALMFTNGDLARVQNVLVQIEINQSIVQNGGFETGDFTGWTLAGDTVLWFFNGDEVCNVVATDADFPSVVHSGNFGAYLGQNGYAAALSQTVPTIPGQSYLVSFWLDDLQAVDFQQFSAIWNGANLTSLVTPPAFTWSNFQFVAVADDTNATLEFDAESDQYYEYYGQNYFGLDDVTVTPVPPVGFTGYGFSTNGFQITWPTLAGVNYQVLCTTDLVQGLWTTNAVVACTNLTTFVDTNAPNGAAQEFYRLELVVP